MAAESPVRTDRNLLYRLAIVAGPGYPIGFAGRCVGLASTAMIGRHFTDPSVLAAVGLSNVICNITGFASVWGLTAGMCTICSQDWGAGNYLSIGIAVQRVYAILLIFVCTPLLIVWLASERVLVGLGQHAEVARYVGMYTSIRCVSLPIMAATSVVSRALSAMSNVQISLIMSITANMLNILLSVMLIPWIGFIGAPITATVCDIYECVGLIVLASRNPDFRKCWGGFSLHAFKQWGSYFKLACPAFVLMCIEWWTWDLQTFIAGYISMSAQAVQAVAPGVGDVQYCLGQAMGSAAATVVGNMLGEGDIRSAKRAAALTMMVTFGLMLVQLVIFIIFRTDLARLFTQEENIFAGIVSLLPLALLFSFVDGHQAAMCGVIQGAGKQDVGAGIVFTCYWIVGVPLGIVLAFGFVGPAQGLKGQWIGMLLAVVGHFSLFAFAIWRLDWEGIAADILRRTSEERSRSVRLMEVTAAS